MDATALSDVQFTSDILGDGEGITIPQSLLESLNIDPVDVFFTVYPNPVFFPLAASMLGFEIGTAVIGATVAGSEVVDAIEDIVATFKLSTPV